MTQASSLERIFVLIPSYRDPECHRTITDLFEKAAHPERVFVGVAWQYDAEKDAAYLAEPYPRQDQVRVKHFALSECKGAGWARNEALDLWQGEEYVMQIQAHHRFEKGWDSTLIDMLARCPSEKPVIALWPPNYSPTPQGDQITRRVQRTRINAMGGEKDAQFVHLTSDFLEPGDPRLGLYQTPWWIGCFMFARASAFQEVKTDPHIFFWGEELAYSARLFTHGYDLFQNDVPVVYHQWFRQETSDKQDYRGMVDPRNVRSLHRIRHLLGLERSHDPHVLEQLDQYGLGKARKIEDFFTYAGIDLHTRTCTEKAKRGYFDFPPDKEWGRGKIFVQIASYRDPECQHTIADLFAKAKNPDRVFVGLCGQYDWAEDAHCFQVPFPRPAQVRERRVHADDAQGVCWARWVTQGLWRGEEYTLQIDSHMRFVDGWDEKMIDELKACEALAPKPVLSCCIARYTPPNELEPDPKPSVLRSGAFGAEGTIRNRGAFLSTEPPQPLNAAFISAGFLFARSEMMEEVSYDPYLYFEQEEICHAMRLYTHGWDIFSSRTPFVYHYYITVEQKPRPLPWLDVNKSEEQRAHYLFLHGRGIARFNHLTGHAQSQDARVTKDIHLFGLGKARSLLDYENYCGIDFVGKRVSEYALRGGFIRDLLKYVSGIYVPELDDLGAERPAMMSEEERLARLRADVGRRTADDKKKSASSAVRQPSSIFVSIASYRDPECQHTVADLFAKAAHPERVFVGICWQLDAAADGACFVRPYPYPDQVREKRFAHTDAQGVAWARAQAQSLWEGEEYTLQINSHLRFEPGWDESLIDMLGRCNATRPAITAFLPAYTPPDAPINTGGITRLRVQSLAEEGQPALLHLAGDFVGAGDARTGLYPSPFIISNFLFARSRLFHEVPIDPHLSSGGEEASYSARMWTHGYTLFQPDMPIAYFRWSGAVQYRPPHPDPGARLTYARLRHLLGLEFSDDDNALYQLDQYGHGIERPLEAFWDYAGIDMERRQLSPAALKGTWNMQTLAEHAPPLPRIFVAIASYRDPECQHTVKDMFEKATHPGRVFAGIVWQFIAEEDAECFSVPYPRPEQVRVLNIDAREGKGVCWARAKGQGLWQGEEYMLQIDSHMRFEPGWDETLIAMHSACPSEKAVITTYPAGYTPPREIRHHATYKLVAKQFDKEGIFTMASRPIPQKPTPPALPVKGAFAGACMLFAPARVMEEVPYDARLYFFGEEITLSARLWTHGWDIYHPQTPVIYHCWDRKARRTHFDDHKDWPKLNRLSFARVRHLLGTETSRDAEVLQDIGRYGMGSARSLREYQDYCGVDFAKRRIRASAYEGVFPSVPDDEYQMTDDKKKPGPDANRKPPSAIRPPSPGLRRASSGPRKVLETPDCAIFDDFLPQETYNRLYDFVSQADYQYINTQGKVKRVWDLGNGFPLRSANNAFFYAPGKEKPEQPWVYPSKTPFDLFIDHVNATVPQVQHLVGPPGHWEHFSVTAWIYPQGTGLSMHDDGSGVYTGAYVFFLNNEWRPHWGGLLIMMDNETNRAIQDSKKNSGNAYKYHLQKWLHLSGHDQIAMERGLGTCIMPKANRMVYIHPDAFHMVTQVNSSAGDHARMSLAGFFHRGKKDKKADGTENAG